jgi:hemerythrin
MAFQWDSSLETGYEAVDNQHKQLFTALNDLIEASASGQGNTAVMKTMEFLTGYTVKHFADEEKLQIQFNYPDYAVHKRYHDEFKDAANAITDRLINEGPSEALIEEISGIIGDWLLNHIKGDDFRMATYIKAKIKEK